MCVVCLMSSEKKAKLLKELKTLKARIKQVKNELEEIEAAEKFEDVLKIFQEEKCVVCYFDDENPLYSYIDENEDHLKEKYDLLTRDMEYLYTVERTDRDGWDHDNIQWSEIEGDCEYCPSEYREKSTHHGLTLDDQPLPSEVEKHGFLKGEADEGTHEIREKWEHGSEFQRAHVHVNVMGLATRETWKYLERVLSCATEEEEMGTKAPKTPEKKKEGKEKEEEEKEGEEKEGEEKEGEEKEE